MPRSKGSFLQTKNRSGNGDFKRTKKKMRKIGHRSGDTHITIRSRSLQMTEQSIAVEKGSIVSSRNLTLAEVLRQCDHHNYKSRIGSLEGLQDIFESHPAQLMLHLQDVLNACLPLMTDIEQPVRAQFRTFLAFFLRALGASRSVVLTPFMGLVSAYLKSALTNLNHDIRWSAVGPLHQVLTFDVGLLIPQRHELIPLLLRLLRTTKASIDATDASTAAAAAATHGGQQKATVAAGKKKQKKKKKKEARSEGSKVDYGMAVACVHGLLVTRVHHHDGGGGGAGVGGAATPSSVYTVSLEPAIGNRGFDGGRGGRGATESDQMPFGFERPAALRVRVVANQPTSPVHASTIDGGGGAAANGARNGSSASSISATAATAVANSFAGSNRREQQQLQQQNQPKDLPGAIRAALLLRSTTSKFNDTHRARLLNIASLPTPATPFAVVGANGNGNANDNTRDRGPSVGTRTTGKIRGRRRVHGGSSAAGSKASAAKAKAKASLAASSSSTPSFVLLLAEELFVALGELWLQGETPATRVERVVGNLRLLLAIGRIFRHVMAALLNMAGSVSE